MEEWPNARDPEALAWSDAAGGLDTHRNAVLMRVVVTLVAIIYLTIQLTSAHGGGSSPGGFALLLALAELIATVIALAGALRFASRLPPHVTSAAGLAAVCLLVVLLCEIYGVWISWRVIQVTSAAEHASSMWGMPDVGDIETHLKRLPYVQIVSGVAGLVGVLAILGGITAVGRALEDDGLVRRARGLSIAVVGL